MMNTYLAQLRQRQIEEGWTDRRMAIELGISNATWSRLLHGEHGMGMSTVLKCMRRFPEYDDLARSFLAASVPESWMIDTLREQLLTERKA